MSPVPISRLKRWLSDFPNTNGTVVAGLSLIIGTGVIVMVRLAAGLNFPDGYDSWLVFLAALAGVSTLGIVGKRATDIDYARATNTNTTTTSTTTTDTPVGTATVTETSP